MNFKIIFILRFKMNELKQFLHKQDKTKILVLEMCNNKNREKIHQYVENNSTYNSVSFNCEHFESDFSKRLIKCYDCNKKTFIKREDYHFGSLPKCKSILHFGPN
jgi:hypothetical protein